MGLLVVVAIATTQAAGTGHLAWERQVGRVAAWAAYVGWTLHSTRLVARFMLWHHGVRPAQAWPAVGPARAVGHVAAQFALAELIVWLAAPAGLLGLLWLVLLPPVGFAVMHFRPSAVAAVSLLSVALHVSNVVLCNGWGPVPVAMPGFSVAVLFALVFTQIAVGAEKARGEVERLAAELSDANDRLRENAAQAEELAAARERNRLAREIHDGLGHCLTVVHVQLEAAESTHGLGSAHPAAVAVERARSMVRAGLQDVRRSVSALRASPLQGRSLADAVREVASECTSAGLPAAVVVLGAGRDAPLQAAAAVYRGTQEGLTNCRKHARATAATVTLDYRLAGRLRLTVADDGAGAPNGIGAGDGVGPQADQSAAAGFGILGLRERAEQVGGTVDVRALPGGGFELTVEVPA